MDLQNPSFSLVDHNGRHVTLTDFAGKVTIVFFGFSNCLKVCPRALDRLTKVLDIVDSSANCLNALYISIDPERDTPGVLKTFLGQHSNRFIGLTGTQEQVSAAQQAFRVFVQRKQDDGHPGGYAVAHTAITYVLDPEGRLVDHLNDGLETCEITARIANVVEQYASQFPETKGNETRVGHSRPLGGESLRRLDKKQVASLRHIGNLARQPRGDWSNMMGDTDLNDGFGAYRFQLAYAAYALSLAHFHRLPAAPGLFKTTLERLIEKMCHTDVWFYWRDASTGGGIGRSPRKKGATDPIAKDNIMYSAYLQ
ncbi:hypothetical protein LCI18_011586 [Fusarium solani-melongenae]|uniref:Uncharacterized protein n=1 Tax=Fusarium solani subsp. cucurbitae TaxID=2747967 RepID=A0ACD3ZHQ4_FUSSC|nr:hypothetical protein LCI18_011586 [Fusarium solani-melongenae]